MQTAVQDGTETSFRYSLNGLWKFHYARNYKSAVQGFEKEDYCCYDWDDIHVPAHIQMESLSGVGVGYLRGAVLSTRGPGWTGRWCTG